MSDSHSSDEPKLVVDDDWKAQVQKEKEEAERRAKEQASRATKMPPASFPLLVTTLSTQALAAMGFVQDPENQLKPNLDVARHLIDTLAVLEEKTKGNLTEQEAELLEETLHQLRLAYVEAQKFAKSSAEPDAKSESSPSAIELP